MTAATPRFGAVLALAFGLACGLGALHHEVWLDEAQAWLIATRAGSLAEVFHRLRFEGHPGLWHALLHLAGRLWPRVEAMQAVAWACATATAFLVGWRSPFTPLQKALLVFGYFPLFEYGVIARSYALSLLLVAVYGAMRHAGVRRMALLAIPLALLTHTSIFGLIVGWGCAVALAIEAWDRPADGPGVGRGGADAALAGALLAGATAFALDLMLVPPEGTFAPGWTTEHDPHRIATTAAAPVAAFLPLPIPDAARPWNTTWLVWERGDNAFDFLLGGLVLLLAGGALAGRPAALAGFGAAASVFLAFLYIKYPGSLRHHGCLWLAWVIALWTARPAGPRLAGLAGRLGGLAIVRRARPALPGAAAAALVLAALLGPTLLSAALFAIGAGALAAAAAFGPSPAVARVLAGARAFAPGGHGLSALLAVHVAAACWLLRADQVGPFDAGRAIARAIQAGPGADAPVYLLDETFFAYFGPPVSAYLGRDLVHVTHAKTFRGSYLSWDQDRVFPQDARPRALARLPAALPAVGGAWLVAQGPVTAFPAGMVAVAVPFDAFGLAADTPARPALYRVARVGDAGPACPLPRAEAGPGAR